MSFNNIFVIMPLMVVCMMSGCKGKAEDRPKVESIFMTYSKMTSIINEFEKTNSDIIDSVINRSYCSIIFETDSFPRQFDKFKTDWEGYGRLKDCHSGLVYENGTLIKQETCFMLKGTNYVYDMSCSINSKRCNISVMHENLYTIGKCKEPGEILR